MSESSESEKTEKFSEVTKFLHNKNSVWQHFLRNASGQLAKCKSCGRTLKVLGGSTTGLHTHLRSKHDITVNKRPDPEAVVENTKTNSSAAKITKYFHSDQIVTLPLVISRMVALDGLPLKVICTSQDLRNGLNAQGFKNVPTSPNTIRTIVTRYAQETRASMINNFDALKKIKDERFSVTLDEWTSTRNRRYLNVNVHSKNQFWNIGLVRINGSLPAAKCVELLKTTMKTYNLCLEKDIVSITTDGAAVMKSVGRLLTCEQQLCFAHGIHLAVSDVLYKNSVQEIETAANFTVIEIDNLNNSNLNGFDNSEDEEDDCNESECGFTIGINNNCGAGEEYQITESYGLGSIITKVRKVVKIFRRSPSKNDDVLQTYVKIEHKTELTLILDSPTRWNSLLDMLERFILLKTSVQKALIDIRSPIYFSDREFDLIENMISNLLPVKLAVEAICRQDANLLTADAALPFMMTKLNSNNNFGEQLKAQLDIRIAQRRTDISSVLQYLHNGNCNKVLSSFKRLPNVAIAKIIANIYQRTRSVEVVDVQIEPIVHINAIDIEEASLRNENVPNLNSKCLQEELQAKIEKDSSSTAVLNISKEHPSSSTLLTDVKREMKFFEANGTRGPILQFVYTDLQTIQPTSVEAERSFSMSGRFCSKIRSRLGDTTLSDLCFLNSHFRKQKTSKN